MKIVQPYAHILNIDQYGNDRGPSHPFTLWDGKALLRKIEWCGRVSHRSEDVMENISSLVSVDVDYERTEKFIKAVVLGHGDWSIVEHASVSVDFLVDRGITHEIVRHRLFSYTQESTRFVNYEKKMPAAFIQPPELDDTAQPSNELSSLQWWKHAIDTCELSYKRLIKMGIKPQIARSVFPNALASRIIMTGNLRSWRHFLIMRTTKEAHPQMREVTIPLLEEFQKAIPILFEDIIPNSRQIDNLRLPK